MGKERLYGDADICLWTLVTEVIDGTIENLYKDMLVTVGGNV